MQRPNSQAGFTLIQISVLLTVASLILVTLLPTTQGTVKSNRGSFDKMTSIMTALRQYQAATCSLPCPADPTLPIGATNYGRAAANPGTVGNCIGGSPAAAYADTTKHIAIGMVPIYTIGLSYDYALDGWGRDITYAVDTGATNNAAGTAAITINDFGTTQNSVVALVSHGQDGYGAWLPLAGSSGTASRFDNGSTDNSQADNAQVASGGGLTPLSTFTSFVNQNQTSTFDDNVVYRSNLWNINNMPAVLKATITPPANGTYGTGQVLTFTITSASTITVTGTPRLVLKALGTGSIGTSNTAYAGYTSGSGTKTLTFTYTVQSTDSAPTSGLSMLSSIDLNGGTATISPCLPFAIPDLSKVLIKNSYLFIPDDGNDQVVEVNTNTGAWIQAYGSTGTSDNQLHNPQAVILDNNGNLWITDSFTHRIIEENSSGQWLMTIGGAAGDSCAGTYVNATTCANIPGHTACCKPNAGSCTCTAGNASGQFNIGDDIAQQIAFDTSGNNIWATDYHNNRVQAFSTSTGVQTFSFSTTTPPSGIAVDSGGEIWVARPSTGDIIQCTTAGACTSYGSGKFAKQALDKDYIAIDKNGNIWVTDQSNNKVHEFNSSGTYLGDLPGTYDSPSGIFIDSSGYAWVSDLNLDRVYKIDPSSGTILLTVGTDNFCGSNTNPLELCNPQNIFISSR